VGINCEGIKNKDALKNVFIGKNVLIIKGEIVT